MSQTCLSSIKSISPSSSRSSLRSETRSVAASKTEDDQEVINRQLEYPTYAAEETTPSSYWGAETPMPVPFRS